MFIVEIMIKLREPVYVKVKKDICSRHDLSVARALDARNCDWVGKKPFRKTDV